MTQSFPATNHSDLLLTLIGEGDGAAFEQYYKRYALRLRQFARSMGVSSKHVLDDLDDTVQEIFLAVWQKAKTYKTELGSAEGWTFALARHRVIDRWRKVGRGPELLALDEDVEKIGGGGRGAARPISDMMSSAWSGASDKLDFFLTIKDALRALTKDEQHLFSRFFINGMTTKQCSVASNIPEGTVKWRLARLVTKIRAQLAAPPNLAESFCDICHDKG